VDRAAAFKKNFFQQKEKSPPGAPGQTRNPGFPENSSSNKIKIVHRSSFPKKYFSNNNNKIPTQRSATTATAHSAG